MYIYPIMPSKTNMKYDTGYSTNGFVPFVKADEVAVRENLTGSQGVEVEEGANLVLGENRYVGRF